MEQKSVKLDQPLFQLGDLVTYITNPFLNSISELIVKAKSEYTPPILVVFEISNAKNFNEQTGKKDVQYNCIFFNTKTCLFERKWFKEIELRLIEENRHNDAEADTKGLTDVQKYVNKKYILTSVDFELKKLKSNYEKTENARTKITANLDFVPPILTILEVLQNENKKVFDTVTGTKLRSQILLKCKWYNSAKQGFSEEILPLNVLKSVEEYDIQTASFLLIKKIYICFPKVLLKTKFMKYKMLLSY